VLKISNRQQALEEICNKFTDEFRVLLLYYIVAERPIPAAKRALLAAGGKF
jgi:hypothetical protein